jgi:Luciferase-like monooxygenase
MGDRGGLKVDGAVSSQLANVAEAATMLERRGYDCCWTAEINHDPFLPLVLAAEHTRTIELGTSIAVAFARNPMTVANVTTKRYFEEVTTPALLRGMERSGRKRGEFQLSCPLFVVTGNDDAELAANAIGTRKQIAFYASTPAYRKVLELHGWGDLQTELHRLSLQGGWDEMGSLIDGGSSCVRRRRPSPRTVGGDTRALRRRDRSRPGGLSVVRRRGHRDRRSEGIAFQPGK